MPKVLYGVGQKKIMSNITRFSFSGHESFPCKSLWLKKGYDYMAQGKDFNDPHAVVDLGVGKNMVASIRFWLKAFGLSEQDKPTELADYLFGKDGNDPYIEDAATLWLLHYEIVSQGIASLYNIVFNHFQRHKKEFEAGQILRYVKQLMITAGKESLINENTIRKDINVLLSNYVAPPSSANRPFEDFSMLLIDLNAIVRTSDKVYAFNQDNKRDVPWQIFLYALLDTTKGSKSVDYDTLQEIGLSFCMSDLETIAMCKTLEHNMPQAIRYTDTAGLRQIQITSEVSPVSALDNYYKQCHFQ